MKASGFALSAVFILAGAVSIPAVAQNDSGTSGASNNSPQNAPIPSIIHLTPPKSSTGDVTTNNLGYRPGQPVQIAFAIHNPTNKPVGYDYPTTEQFDVTVNDAQGNPVWDWAKGRVFRAAISHLTLKPDQTRTYRVRWNGLDAHGRPVPPGVYTVNARMTSNDRPAVTGNLLVDVDTDPENVGVPTRTPAENGVVRNVYPTPPITASATIAIGVPVAKH